MTREELGSLLRLLVDTGRITAADAATMVVRFDLGELAVGELPVPLREMPGRLTPIELAIAMQNVAVRLTPKQAAPFLAAATKPVTMQTPPEVKRFLRERLRNHFRQNYDNTIAGYTHALAQGGDVSFWQKKMSLEQRAYIARMTTAGLGRPLATAEIDRISQTAIVQQGYLYKFAGEISARRAIGRPHSEAYLQARARQYGGEGWAAWFAGNETVENRGDGYVARYTAHDDERTCGPCLDAMNGSPYLPSLGPLPGQVCRGHGLCRCRREVVFDMEAWQRLSGVAPSPTVAPTEPPIVPEPVAVEPIIDKSPAAIRERLAMQPETQRLADLDRQYEDVRAQYVAANQQYDKSASMSNEEREQLRSRINYEFPQKIKELQEQRGTLAAEMRSVLLKEIELPKDEQAKVTLHLDNIKTSGTKKVVQPKTDEAADFINRITAVKQFPSDKFNVVVNVGTRRANATPGAIHMSSKDSVRIFVHEIGHNIEYKRGAEGRAERVAFYDARTAGEKATRLNSLFPDQGYGRDEITKRDKWVHPYTGKIYPDSDKLPASEIVSMGIEALYAEPHKLINDDPEFFDFMLSYLQGK